VFDIVGGLRTTTKIQIKGIQVKDKEWQFDLKKKGGKYIYLRFIASPLDKKIIKKSFLPQEGNTETESLSPLCCCFGAYAASPSLSSFLSS
jgi:hypothetical protein